MIQDTSIHAYRYSVVPNLGERQRAVYNFLLDNGPLTNLEMAEAMELPINTITPRTRELVKLGIVRPYEQRKCRQSGNTAISWEASRDTLF